MEIIQSLFSDYYRIKLKSKNWKISGKSKYLGKWSHQNNSFFKENLKQGKLEDISKWMKSTVSEFER